MDKKYIIAIAISYTLAIAAICISLWRCEPFQIDTVAALANILALMVTILLGIIAYNYFIQKDEVYKFKKEIKELVVKEKEDRNKQFVLLQKQVKEYNMSVIDNPEWGYLITDSTGKYLIFGIRHDGSVDWSIGVPKPIEEELSKLRKRVEILEKKE